MKIKWGLFIIFLVSGLLLTNFISLGQQKSKKFQAYLILKCQNTVIQKDSSFEKELRTQLYNVLITKKITLVSNEEMETAELLHMYFDVTVDDSLRISLRNGGTWGNSTITTPYCYKVYAYKDKQDVIRKVIFYVKENILNTRSTKSPQ